MRLMSAPRALHREGGQISVPDGKRIRSAPRHRLRTPWMTLTRPVNTKEKQPSPHTNWRRPEPISKLKRLALSPTPIKCSNRLDHE